MSEGNGNSQHAASKEFKPRLIFWEVTKGCNSALYPLSRNGDGVDVARRSADRQGARHHPANCQLWQSDPGAKRRRAAVSP